MKLCELAFFTDNVETMTAFYRRLLGSEPVGETKLFIHRNYMPAAGELPPTNHIAFAVADVDAACQALQQEGLTVEVAPTDYYWGRSAYLRDPDGQQIELTQT
jgi:catechol 2,3-dioxygenase-like lactoylglutathione lyase family enzyme